MAKTLLLVSQRGDDEAFLSEVARSAELDLKICATADEAVDFVSENDCRAVFVDITEIEQLRDFETQVQEKLGLFSDRIDTNSIHFMSDRDMSANRDAILSPLFGNFFQRPSSEIEDVAQTYGRYVGASERKNTHDLKNFLGPKVVLQKVVLTNSGQKQQAVEAVRQYLIAAKVKPRIANLIANAVDELLMNALFDAPCDEFGRQLFDATDRSTKRELNDRERVTMTLGFDGHNVGISVADQFGSVDRNRLLQHVTESYKKKNYAIRHGQAGAGLGIATVFSSGGSLIYHCESNVKTEATLLYRAFSSFRAFKHQFKFFSAKFFG